MSFDKVLNETNCDCLSTASENTVDAFARRVRNSPELKAADFRSSFDRERKPNDEHNCDEVCGMHGISFDIWNDDSKEILLEKYLYTASIAGRWKNNLCVVTFKKGSGLLKHTPNQIEYSPFHHDFYKTDDFDVSQMNLVEMIKLLPSNV